MLDVFNKLCTGRVVNAAIAVLDFAMFAYIVYAVFVYFSSDLGVSSSLSEAGFIFDIGVATSCCILLLGAASNKFGKNIGGESC